MSPNEVLSTVKKELAVLETSGERPGLLEKVYKALLTLPPSSTEAERTFSTTGFFVSKLRTSLNDDTIDTLVLLKSYLRK